MENTENITIDYSDITEELCKLCGACCSVYIPVELDERAKEFYTTLGLSCEQHGDVTLLNLGECPHLQTNETGKYLCKIYIDRPKLCKDYNCVAWWKYTGQENSEIIKKAQEVKVKLLDCKNKLG